MYFLYITVSHLYVVISIYHLHVITRHVFHICHSDLFICRNIHLSFVWHTESCTCHELTKSHLHVIMSYIIYMSEFSHLYLIYHIESFVRHNESLICHELIESWIISSHLDAPFQKAYLTTNCLPPHVTAHEIERFHMLDRSLLHVIIKHVLLQWVVARVVAMCCCNVLLQCVVAMGCCNVLLQCVVAMCWRPNRDLLGLLQTCRALLQTYRAPLQTYRALLQICRACL